MKTSGRVTKWWGWIPRLYYNPRNRELRYEKQEHLLFFAWLWVRVWIEW